MRDAVQYSSEAETSFGIRRWGSHGKYSLIGIMLSRTIFTTHKAYVHNGHEWEHGCKPTPYPLLIRKKSYQACAPDQGPDARPGKVGQKSQP